MLNSSRWNYCYIFLNFRAIVLVDSKCSLVTAHIILHIERPDSDSVEIVGVPQNLFAFGFCLWLLTTRSGCHGISATAQPESLLYNSAPPSTDTD